MALALNNPMESTQVQDLAKDFDSSSNHSDSRRSADDHEDDLQKCEELDEEDEDEDSDMMESSQGPKENQEDDHQFHIEDGMANCN